jgi:enoyl-CoA hydratase/carnithine racemase
MSDPNLSTELDAHGVLLARVDMPGRAMNVFSASMMDSLEALLKRAESDAAVKAVVLTSSKPAFIAGADLEMIKMFAERARNTSPAELHGLFGHLGRLFRRIELCAKPWVAAINGLALGGGLEVAMGCHARVASNDEKNVQLGLPEIKLGLLPGAGGTQRLPRLVGAAKGLEMLLIGDPVGPAEALRLGLVDEVVPPEQLIEAAKRRALSIGKPQARWDSPGFRADANAYDFSDAQQARAAIARTLKLSDYQLQYYPAYDAIIRCTVGGWNLALGDGTRHEMDIFVDLMCDAVAGNMVRTLFLNRQKAAKLGLLKPDSVFSSGDDALLPRLQAAQARAKALGLSEDEHLTAVAFAALAAWSAGKVEQPELADVAAVNAGLFPSYTGGPFTYLHQTGAARLRAHAQTGASHDAALFALPAALDDFLAKTAAP